MNMVCFRFITQEGHKLEAAPRPPMAVTNAVSWRSEGLKYRKNEVFLDVIESVNLLVGVDFEKCKGQFIQKVAADSRLSCDLLNEHWNHRGADIFMSVQCFL